MHTLATAFAILDIAFHPSVPDTLCAATSTGSLAFYTLSISSPTTKSLTQSSPSTQLNTSAQLVPGYTLQLFPHSTLVLDLEFHPQIPTTLGATLSTGEVVLLSLRFLTNSSGEPTVTEVARHDLEAWTLAFGLHHHPQPTTPSASEKPHVAAEDGLVLFSGGDDAMIKYARLDDQNEVVASWEDRRVHGAGVTAILPIASEVLITGSYDDRVRVMGVPEVGRKSVLAECDLGGGVWRLRMMDDSKEGRWVVLASCMHAGARIVEIKKDEEGEWRIEVLAKFEEHKSMNYGSDVMLGQGRTRMIISTSFYDKLLCLWRYDMQD